MTKNTNRKNNVSHDFQFSIQKNRNNNKLNVLKQLFLYFYSIIIMNNTFLWLTLTLNREL